MAGSAYRGQRGDLGKEPVCRAFGFSNIWLWEHSRVFASLLKATPFGSTFGCYRVQVFVTLARDARLHYEEYATLKKRSELFQTLTSAVHILEKIPTLYSGACDGSSSIIHLP